MAQKIQTLFIDDLDGSEAEGTVRFGLDGVEYEIDLSAEHSPGAAGRAGALCGCGAAGWRGYPAAGPQRAPGICRRAEPHGGPGVGHGAGYRGQGPRPGAG